MAGIFIFHLLNKLLTNSLWYVKCTPDVEKFLHKNSLFGWTRICIKIYVILNVSYRIFIFDRLFSVSRTIQNFWFINRKCFEINYYPWRPVQCTLRTFHFLPRKKKQSIISITQNSAYHLYNNKHCISCGTQLVNIFFSMYFPQLSFGSTKKITIPWRRRGTVYRPSSDYEDVRTNGHTNTRTKLPVESGTPTKNHETV